MAAAIAQFPFAANVGIFMRLVPLCLALCLVPSATSSNNTGEGKSSKDEALSIHAEAHSVSDAVKSAPGVARNGLGVVSSAALPKAELCRTAASEAAANNLPTRFFTNLIQQESGFRPDVVSPAGAQGIAQFMPSVASSYGLENPFEPVAALKASARLLADLVEQFGNLGLAAAAYNAGPKRVQDWMNKRRHLPAETRHYVYKITGRPAEHWANQPMDVWEVSLPIYADCPDMPIVTMANQIGSAAVVRKSGSASGRDGARANVAQNQPGPMLSAPDRGFKARLGQLADVRLSEISQRQTSVRFQHNGPTSPASRFVAMPTPANNNDQSPRHARSEKKGSEGSLRRQSEFIVGARVPTVIKASEAAVIAGKKMPASWSKEVKNRARMADAASALRGPSSRPQRL